MKFWRDLRSLRIINGAQPRPFLTGLPLSNHRKGQYGSGMNNAKAKKSLRVAGVFVTGVLFGCGPAQKGETRRAAPQCHTEPKILSVEILETAKTQLPAQLLTRYGMSAEQFRAFLDTRANGETVTAEQEALLKDMQLGDLTHAQEEVASCNPENSQVQRIDKEGDMGLEVFVAGHCTDGTDGTDSTDGTEARWKVKLIEYEACLYLGAID